MSDRRFVILDPCLVSAGSHPLHLAIEVLAAAAEAGFVPHAVTHRGFDARDCPAGWSVTPAFVHTSYSKHNAYGGLDRLDARGRPAPWPRSPWAALHARRRRRERIAAFAHAVAPTLAELRPGDIVLLATASELEAAGLARAIAAVAPPVGVGWHVLFHFPLLVGFAPDFPRQERRLGPVADLLRDAAAAAAPHRLHWHATTAELAAQYARLGAGPVSILPYPLQAGAVRAAAGGTGPLRIACLGDARPEKGSQHLAAVIEHVLAEPTLANHVAFAVQTNLGFPPGSTAPEHRAVRESLGRLAVLADRGERVDLLAGPLAPGAYARELRAADAVLMPYDQSRYRVRCSGVILEALAAAAVPIVTGGGWMARQLAAPHRRHVATIVARSTRHDAAVLRPRPLGAGRPAVIPLAPPPAAGSGHALLAVTAVWRPDGGWLDEPPLRLELAGERGRTATVIAPAEDGLATALLPAAELGAGLRLSCGPACGAAATRPGEIHARWLVAADRPPVAAVGLVIDSPGDVPAAITELARHRDHYRATAATHAVAVRAASSGAALVRELANRDAAQPASER